MGLYVRSIAVEIVLIDVSLVWLILNGVLQTYALNFESILLIWTRLIEENHFEITIN
jgi:hypothetical protein